MDDRLNDTIDKVCRLSDKNPEFGRELRKRLGIAYSANSALADDEKINEIYEYCIEKIIRKQAEEFYSGFPLTEIIPMLIGDFIRMETFKRKDNFGDFCLACYQQIECITNYLCSLDDLGETVNKMYECPAYVDSKTSRIDDRVGKFSIASLIFGNKNNKDTGVPYAETKPQSPLQKQYANDKMCIVVYFIGYKCRMTSQDYISYRNITYILNEIYQCRNMNHRGNNSTEWEQKTINKILPLQSLYYLKFYGALAQYIDLIKDGYSHISELVEYSRTL